MPIDKIKKRDGRVADFDRSRIVRAIGKACEEVNFSVSPEVIGRITDAVVVTLESRFGPPALKCGDKALDLLLREPTPRPSGPACAYRFCRVELGSFAGCGLSFFPGVERC